MADPETPTPYICPHVPHTPGRCYRRDGAVIASTFANTLPEDINLYTRTCVECGLPTDQIDALSSG